MTVIFTVDALPALSCWSCCASARKVSSVQTTGTGAAGAGGAEASVPLPPALVERAPWRGKMSSLSSRLIASLARTRWKKMPPRVRRRPSGRVSPAAASTVRACPRTARPIRTEAVHRVGDGADERGHGLAEHSGDATGQGPHVGGTETYIGDGCARASVSSCNEAPAGPTSVSTSPTTPTTVGLPRSPPVVAVVVSWSTASSRVPFCHARTVRPVECGRACCRSV